MSEQPTSPETAVEFENPYFDDVAGGVTIGANRADWSTKAVDTLRRREDLVEQYAWAIPNRDAIETIVDHGPIIEVGAGSGYWAWCVRQLGGEILPTDIDTPHDNEWTPVWNADAKAVARDYPDRTLLMVWPPFETTMAVETLGTYRSAGGDTCIYVGEGRGGCTGTDRFHQMLHEEWELEERVAIPAYPGLRDRLEVWRQ